MVELSSWRGAVSLLRQPDKKRHNKRLQGSAVGTTAAPLYTTYHQEEFAFLALRRCILYGARGAAT